MSEHEELNTQHTAFTFAMAAQSGPYDEAPVLPETLDIALTISRNDRSQPFHLICEHDCVLVTMSGAGRIEFIDSSVRTFDYVIGDVIYVPARTPHRILPIETSVHHRFKLPETELEAVSWYCEGCGSEIHRDVWELVDELPQEGYLRACNEFNGNPDLRRCPSCHATHPELDLEGYRWGQVALDQRAQTDG